MSAIVERLRSLVGVLERLDGTWRRAHGFTANEALVIGYLAGDGPLAPVRLSELVGLTTAGMSTLLDRLEHRGFIDRRRDPRDGRRVLVTLTKRAVRARAELDDVHASVAAGVDGADADVVARFLEHAAQVAQAHAEAISAAHAD